MVLWLIFKFFIHFEFFLVYCVSWWSNFIILHVPVQFSQYHLLNKLFIPLYILASFFKYYLTIKVCVDFWAFCSISLIFLPVIILVPDCFGLLLFQNRIVWYPSTSFYFLKIAEVIWGLFWFHINCWNIFSRSLKFTIGILIRFVLNYRLLWVIWTF